MSFHSVYSIFLRVFSFRISFLAYIILQDTIFVFYFQQPGLFLCFRSIFVLQQIVKLYFFVLYKLVFTNMTLNRFFKYFLKCSICTYTEINGKQRHDCADYITSCIKRFFKGKYINFFFFELQTRFIRNFRNIDLNSDNSYYNSQ